MQKQEYVSKEGYNKWVTSVNELHIVDNRINISLIADILGYRHSYISSIINGEHKLPYQVYEWWFEDFIPKIQNRIVDYQQMTTPKLSVWLNSYWKEYRSKLKEAGFPIQNLPISIENQQRRPLLNAYDIIKDYPSYRETYQMVQTDSGNNQPIRYNQKITQEAQTILNDLRAKHVPISRLQYYLMPGERVFNMLIDNQHQAKLQRRLLAKVNKVMPQLRQCKEIANQCKERYGKLINAHQLAKDLGKSLDDIAEDCKQLIGSANFLSGRNGKYIQRTSRGKVIMIYIMEQVPAPKS